MKKRITAAVLAMCVTLGSIGISAAASEEQPETDTGMDMDTAAVKAAAESTLSTSSSKDAKESTVYVIADANGHRQKTIVSSWLKNKHGVDELKDRSTLTDIQNVKGDESYVDNGDGTITWNAEGNDIYYQGTTTEELPVDVQITYYLDGRKVSAEELDGASGHLRIAFRYENNTGRRQTINGEDCTIYKPYVMVSGILMDEEKAKNIEVENGRVISDGNQAIVVGMALPGLKEGLGLDDVDNADDIEIPEKVVIDADVENFSLLTTLTLASDDALKQIGLDDIDSVDELKDQMDELSDASRV